HSITTLRHVLPKTHVNAADDIAGRVPYTDFDRFKPAFDQVANDLQSGIRTTRRFGHDAEINAGEFFILNGQTTYVATKGELFQTPNGHPDARLRVIYA